MLKTAPTKQTIILTNDHEHILWEKGCLVHSTPKQLLDTTKTIENPLKVFKVHIIDNLLIQIKSNRYPGEHSELVATT